MKEKKRAVRKLQLKYTQKVATMILCAVLDSPLAGGYG